MDTKNSYRYATAVLDRCTPIARGESSASGLYKRRIQEKTSSSTESAF